jgi:hypothetical protein
MVVLLLGLLSVSAFTTVRAAPVTPTPITPTSHVDAPRPRLSFETLYRSNDASATDSQINPYIVLHNLGSSRFRLSDLTLRYWYTRDGAQDQTYRCISATPGCANVTATIGSLSSPVSTADSYLEIGFTPGAGDLTSDYVEIESQITRSDGSSYNETNDYTYNTTEPGRLYSWSEITVYYKGLPVSGLEPVSHPPSTPEATVSLSASRVDIGGTIVVSASSNLYLPQYSLEIIDASTDWYQDQNNPLVLPAEPLSISPSTLTGGASWTLTARRAGVIRVRLSVAGEFYWWDQGRTYRNGAGANSERVVVGGGPTPTSTSTPTPLPTSTSTPTPTTTPLPPTASLKAQYKVNDGSATDNQIKPGLRVVNTGTSSVALSDITIRYWYTGDGAQSQSYSCDYAAVGCANVTGTFGTPSNPTSTADRYVEIGFKTTAGSLVPGASSGEIQSRLNKSDWSSYNEANDYSYSGTQTSFADWTKATVYYKGSLVWGSEPNSPRPTGTPTVTPTPTPVTPTVPANLPDLTITSMWIGSQSSSCPQGLLGLWVQVANIGTADAGPFRIVANGATQTIAGLAAGQSLSVWLASNVYGNTHSAGVALTNQAAESNTENNQRVQLLPIPTPLSCPTTAPTNTPTPTAVTPTIPRGLPDLVASSIDISSETSGCPPGPWRLRVTIANLGEADAGPFTVTLNGKTQTVQGLAAHQSIWVWFDYASTSPSTAVVDSANQVQESNENNNQRTQPLYIPTQPSCPSPTPLGGSLHVQYQAGNTSAGDNQIRPHITIVNTGASAVPLSELTVRYWYTVDGDKAQSFACDYAIVGCANVKGAFAKLSVPRAGADTYLELSFTGTGTIAAGGQTGAIQTRLNKTDWTNYNESDDYSFDPSKTTFADWSRVTLYRNGLLVWGSEP